MPARGVIMSLKKEMRPGAGANPYEMEVRIGIAYNKKKTLTQRLSPRG